MVGEKDLLLGQNYVQFKLDFSRDQIYFFGVSYEVRKVRIINKWKMEARIRQ